MTDSLTSRKRVCPWWLCFTFDNPLRKLLHNPEAIMGPYVRAGGPRDVVDYRDLLPVLSGIFDTREVVISSLRPISAWGRRSTVVHEVINSIDTLPSRRACESLRSSPGPFKAPLTAHAFFFKTNLDCVIMNLWVGSQRGASKSVCGLFSN